MFIAKVKMVAAVTAVVIVTGTAVPVGIAVAQAVGKEASMRTNTASVVDGVFITLSPRPDYEVPDYPANSLPEAEATLQGEADKHFAKKETKEYELAAAAYDAFVLKYPKSKAAPYALVRKGRSLQFVGKRSEAIKIYGDVLAYYPDLASYAAPALLYVAQCRYLDGNVKEATKAIAELCAGKDYPANSLPEAEATLQGEADKHFAKNEQKEYELAAAAYDAFVLKYPKSKAVPYALVRKGRSLQFVGKRFEAIKVYQEVLAYYPDLTSYAASALLYVAQCHYLDKNVKEATKAIAQLHTDKDYGKYEKVVACAMFLSARMQAEGGKTDEALATLREIENFYPAYAALAQLRQAEVYEKAGRTAEAVAAYRATLTKYPDAPEAALAHGAIDKMGNRTPDGATVNP